MVTSADVKIYNLPRLDFQGAPVKANSADILRDLTERFGDYDAQAIFAAWGWLDSLTLPRPIIDDDRSSSLYGQDTVSEMVRRGWVRTSFGELEVEDLGVKGFNDRLGSSNQNGTQLPFFETFRVKSHEPMPANAEVMRARVNLESNSWHFGKDGESIFAIPLSQLSTLYQQGNLQLVGEPNWTQHPFLVWSTETFLPVRR